MVFCSKEKGSETEKIRGGGNNKKKQPKPPFSWLPSVSVLQSRACVHLVDGPNPERFAKAQIKRDKDLTHHFLWFLKKPKLYGRGFANPIQPLLPTRASAPPRDPKRAVLMTHRDG